MLRIKILALVATLACVAGGSAAAVASASPAHQSANHNVTLSIKSTSIGKILVQNGGVIVYMFTRDSHGKNTCPASNGCASVWPPIVGTPKIGAGVNKRLIGSIMDGSEHQVTYAGHPLYGYDLNSTSPSYVSTSQFGGIWDALSASGSIVKYRN